LSKQTSKVLLQKNVIIMPKFLYKDYFLSIFIVINMVNMTLAIPEKLHKFMKEHKEIRWTEVVRRALWDYVYKIQRMEKKKLNVNLEKIILSSKT